MVYCQGLRWKTTWSTWQKLETLCKRTPFHQLCYSIKVSVMIRQSDSWAGPSTTGMPQFFIGKNVNRKQDWSTTKGLSTRRQTISPRSPLFAWITTRQAVVGWHAVTPSCVLSQAAKCNTPSTVTMVTLCLARPQPANASQSRPLAPFSPPGCIAGERSWMTTGMRQKSCRAWNRPSTFWTWCE